ncbi:MAG: hypothetical protein PWQ90_1580, partial [Pseudothermotoga sp.]|nr:hypothetical protein [Pseudothermotoga sp.]
MEKRRSPTCS